ncbi:MAG TPA: hypothetical protein VFF06_33310 [Polyangia bacterium]|nr:hypothetical protein [Polyangia bacterium]
MTQAEIRSRVEQLVAKLDGLPILDGPSRTAAELPHEAMVEAHLLLYLVTLVERGGLNQDERLDLTAAMMLATKVLSHTDPPPIREHKMRWVIVEHWAGETVAHAKKLEDASIGVTPECRDAAMKFLHHAAMFDGALLSKDELERTQAAMALCLRILVSVR